MGRGPEVTNTVFAFSSDVPDTVFRLRGFVKDEELSWRLRYIKLSQDIPKRFSLVEGMRNGKHIDLLDFLRETHF